MDDEMSEKPTEYRKLSEFLDELVTNMELQADFDREPEEAMRVYGLSDHHIWLVQEGSLAEIREELQTEQADAVSIVYVIRMGAPTG
jgi:hypothetical protein